MKPWLITFAFVTTASAFAISVASASPLLHLPAEARPETSGSIAPIDTLLPSCDPRILTAPSPGTTEAHGSGLGTTSALEINDPSADFPTAPATLEWSFRAQVVETPGNARLGHEIGGNLNIDITTDTGQVIRFRAHCIAGAGTYVLPVPGITEGGLIIYANGITTGWPSNPEEPDERYPARRSFVHFEAIELPDGSLRAYLALVNGVDCNLDFGSRIVTRSIIGGTGEHTATRQRVYTETECARLAGPGRSTKPPFALGPWSGLDFAP